MMRVFAPSAAITSDATTTSGLDSGLSSASQSKNSYFKLILCCFLPNSIQVLLNYFVYDPKAESFSSLVSFVNKYTVLETICVWAPLDLTSSSAWAFFWNQ